MYAKRWRSHRLFKELLSTFFVEFLELFFPDVSEYLERVDRIEPARQEEVMQIVTSWMEEGLEQGRLEERQQGLEEGRRQEALALVLRQLARRVGEVEPELQEQIQALAIAQIEDLGEALLDFSTKADLEDWLEDCASRLESSSDSPDSE